MQIRRTHNLELIQKLNDRFFPQLPLTKEELNQSDWWICWVDNIAAGFGGIKKDPSKDKAFLIRSGVLQEYRGLGIQKKLINARVKFSKKEGIPRVYTYVWAGNLPSMRSLLSCGFKPYYMERTDECTYIYLENMPKS